MVNAPTVQEVAARGALVVVGAAGEGRSTLLAEVASRATGWTVRSLPGHADESGIPYAALQRLLGRVPDGDLLTKALATAGLLRAAAPVLCLVDDAHLLDPSSWQVLKLAARRLDGAPVAILASAVATAAGFRAAAGLPQLRLAPLDDGSARELLLRRAPDLTGDMATAVIELAAGNPAALTDLAGALTPEQRRGYAPPPVALPPDSALLHRLRAELAVLPPRTRHALLLAAADPGIAGADLEPAELAGLVLVEGAVVRFTPALLRTVVYHGAPIGRRRAAHLDLARIRAGQGRRLPALLHRAAVATGPDARLAGELIEAAAQAGPATADSRALCEWAYALLDLVAGRSAPAAARLAAVVTAPAGRASAPIRVAVIPHLVEAAGAAEPLDDVVTAFDRWAVRTGQTPWLALLSRCRALAATDAAAADDHFREALRRHRDDESDFARAHTELLYGRHLRRRRRHREARDHLRRAVEAFHRLDAGPWAEQTARELRAAGERPPTRPPGPPLTAQQERIAGLVADGATNREVAQQLHLSPRTVDHHLRNVFARLGVRSRTELARLMVG